MQIKVDDLRGTEVIHLLEEHMQDMQSTSPPESVHALDLEGLRAPNVTFWSAWENTELTGCGALKELSSTSGEIKSMRTTTQHRRRGVAANILTTIIDTAKTRGYQQLYLETGSMIEFESARLLYTRFGFIECAPFEDYVEDPNSVFMVLQL
ncbi:MAG: GNAT family N-acetyltransferase [Granulosicoccus sp.]